MRTKFLSILASFLVLSLAVTSCLDSDNEYELSSDNIITAFELDTIYYGKKYKFTIDQINGHIFNADSIPVSADTIINKILITTFSTNGYPMSGPEADGSKDTTFYYTDSLDLSKTMEEPLVIRIWPYDGSPFKTYRIEVRRHLQDPDSLVWGGDEQEAYTHSFSSGVVTASDVTKTVTLNGKVLVFASNGTTIQVYNGEPKETWNSTTTSLPNNADLSSLLNFNEILYAVSGGFIYKSSDGIAWTQIPNSNNPPVKNLITTFGNNNDDTDSRIAGIIDNGTDLIFASATVNNDNFIWTLGQKVPDGSDGNTAFPTKNISAMKSYKTATGIQRSLLVGNTDDTETTTTPWFSEDNGLNWAPMPANATKYSLPSLMNPSIIYYGKTFYAFGGDFSTIYTSINGMVWEKVQKKFLFPSEDGLNIFKDRTGYSMVIDENNYIWMVWGKGTSYSDEIWRGKLNKLGFIIQD